jgi:transcriptional regulator with PAS, ATPase and Fis domain
MKYDYFEHINAAVTISDKDGNIIYMNQKSKKTFEKNKSLIGSNLKDCHQEESWKKITDMLQNNTSNTYTIEKNKVKKLIYQTPWYDNQNNVAGLIEFSFEIPFNMNHFVRS